jgi:hypothetical protein
MHESHWFDLTIPSFLTAESSRKPLNITRTSMVRLLTYHQVMAEYEKFLSVFGSREGPPDHLFSGFRDETHLESPSKELSIPELGRSGQHFQLCYNLKTPKSKRKGEWTILQAAIHHQFDVKEGTAFWMITQARLDLYHDINRLTDSFGKEEGFNISSPVRSFNGSLSIHLASAHWAKSGWGQYLQSLSKKVEDRVRHNPLSSCY